MKDNSELESVGPLSEDLGLTLRELEDGVTVLDVNGMIVAENRKHLQTRVEELILDEKKKIALNFSKVTHLDSTGMGTVLLLTNLLKRRGSRLKIFAMQPSASRFFQASGLYRVLHIYPTEADALADEWEA